MKRYGYKAAAALIVLALAAFQFDSQAQNRRVESKSRPSANVSRPASRPAAKPSVKPQRPSVKPNTPAAKPNPRPQRPSAKPSPKPKPHHPAVKSPHRPSKPVYVKPQYRPGYRPIYKPAPRPRPIIVRPSYGSVIAAKIAADMAWTAVNIAYFNTVARTYVELRQRDFPSPEPER